jgi:hypothetical protein
MTIAAKIDKLAAVPGIQSILVESGIRMLRGNPQWHDICRDMLDLFKRCGEETIRAVIGKHTIVVQREGDETAVVVFPLGHPIAKSLRRMLRRAHRSGGESKVGEDQP